MEADCLCYCVQRKAGQQSRRREVSKQLAWVFARGIILPGKNFERRSHKEVFVTRHLNLKVFECVRLRRGGIQVRMRSWRFEVFLMGTKS